MSASNIVSGPGPVLPPLTQWAKNHLTALYQATNADDFTTAFDNFISKDVVSITVNGAKMTRDEYKQTVRQQQFLENTATLKFENVVQALPESADATTDAGLLGLFFTVTIFERIKIRDVTVTHTITSSLNISVAQDPSVIIPKFGIGDRRRVMVLSQVFASAPGTGDAST